ncbi:reverse transcriptase domain-containing protein [Tanacetum coccineum]|uniref:Reverse transcriptase domain-containing protein n=1 Tax=Tanacetum coccineum TaxID=301880 RepID=A0ABQ5I7L2_9ASTR
MTSTQTLLAIQTMADHIQKWHGGTLSRSLNSNSNTDGLAATVSKLANLGCSMKKMKENVHAIQVGCQICEGPHLDKECPLNEVAKQVEEAKYGEFGRPTPFNGNNGGKYRVGPPGYYTRTDNRPPYGEKRPSLEELMNKHLEESARRSTKMNEWIMKLQESAEEIHSRATNEIPSSSTGQCKVVNDDLETQHRPISSRKLINKEGWTTKDSQCQLLPKELNPGNFTLPCTIGNFNFYGMADLGASVNVMPRNIFEYLKLANLRNTNMLVEMADMTKKAPLGIIENILVIIDKFLFPSDFIVIDKTLNETIILGMPFLATIHAEINVFDKEISLGTNNDRVSYDMGKRYNNFTIPTEKNFMIKSDLDNRPLTPASSNNQPRNLHDRFQQLGGNSQDHLKA